MTLERLLEEIESRAQRELKEEEARQAAETRRLTEERDRRISELTTEGERGAQGEAARERAQRIASAKLAARRLEYEAREKQMTASLTEVRRMLSELTKGPEYPPLLKSLYAHAVERLGKGVKVAGRAEDAQALKAVAGKGFDSTPLPILGGLVAETPDKARRLALTFDELLRLREDELRDLLLPD